MFYAYTITEKRFVLNVVHCSCVIYKTRSHFLIPFHQTLDFFPRFSGNHDEFTVCSEGNLLVAQFISDSSQSNSGFSAISFPAGLSLVLLL